MFAHDGFLGMGEEAYYRSMLDLYDEVVVHTEALIEGGIADELQDVAYRVELIVNEKCAVNCPYAVEHIAAMARATESAKDLASGEPNPDCIYDERRDKPRELVDNIYVPNERRIFLADRGYTHFKIDGRGADPAWLMNTMFCEMLHDILDLLPREDMRDIVTPILVLQVFNPESEARLAIPRQLL